MRYLIALFAALLLAGCGGAGFVPASSPFQGAFTASSADIGDLSFTASTSGIGGTGVLRDGTLEVDVAISGNVTGRTISGIVSNTHLGTGTFQGDFHGEKAASGTFTLNIVTGSKLSGTWSATAL